MFDFSKQMPLHNEPSLLALPIPGGLEIKKKQNYLAFEASNVATRNLDNVSTYYDSTNIGQEGIRHCLGRLLLLKAVTCPCNYYCQPS